MAAPHQALLPLIRGEEIPPGVRITTEVVASAEEHGVGALVDYQVARRGIELGQELTTRLAMSAMAVVAENQSAQAAAETVARTARDLGLDIAIFKGIAIGQQFYANPSLRPTIDVDLFVNPGQVERLSDLFAALGASMHQALAVAAIVTEARVFEQSTTVGQATVALHSDPMHMLLRSRLEQQRWDDSTIFQLSSGEPVRTLDLEWTVIQALLHAFRDNFADLLHIYDLDLMFDDDPDWDRIDAIAAAEGWTDVVRFATAFVCSVLGRDTPLPRRIKRANMMLINKVWPQSRLLKGADSIVTGMRRQEALGLLIAGRRRELSVTYLHRIVPSRAVIELRSESANNTYAVGLYRWRKRQRAKHGRMRNINPPSVRRAHETL